MKENIYFVKVGGCGMVGFETKDWIQRYVGIVDKYTCLTPALTKEQHIVAELSQI